MRIHWRGIVLLEAVDLGAKAIINLHICALMLLKAIMLELSGLNFLDIVNCS